jgi:hypothetical protein
LDVVLGKTLEGDPCLWIRENGQGFSAVRFGSSLPSWANGTIMFSQNTAGERNAVIAAPDIPLGLIELNGVGLKNETSDDAVLIWIGKYEKTSLTSLRDKGILPK